MFTGIVESLATVSEYVTMDNTETGGNGVSLTITDVGPVLNDVHLGDSIAVNGVCLTVTEFKGTEWFKVGIAPETLRRTDLGQLKAGTKVDLERAMSANTRFGGHMVQGHVDTVGEIVEMVPDGNSLAVTFKPRDQHILNYIVEKGFIALDGASLTVTGVDDDAGHFSVMLIAYTQNKIVIPSKKIGNLVNIEVDFTGKLIEKQITSMLKKKHDSGIAEMVNKLVDKKLS